MRQRKPELEGANHRGKSRTTAKEPALKQSVIAKRWRITADFDQSSCGVRQRRKRRTRSARAETTMPRLTAARITAA